MKKALAIIEGRPYKFLEDITDIKGISDKTIQELIGLVKPDSINAISDFGNPIDLNNASFQDLLSIPFVSSNTATILQKNTPIDFLDELKPLLSHKELLRIQPYTLQKLINLEEDRELIDLNTASLEALEELPNVGKKSAELIISIRPFKYLDDLILIFSYKKLSDINLYTVQDFKPFDSGLVDLNKATLVQIASLPSITSKKAQIIFDNRPYKYLDELIELKGITDNTAQLIEDSVVQTFENEDSSLIDINKASLLVLQTLPLSLIHI